MGLKYWTEYLTYYIMKVMGGKIEKKTVKGSKTKTAAKTVAKKTVVKSAPASLAKA